MYFLSWLFLRHVQRSRLQCIRQVNFPYSFPKLISYVSCVCINEGSLKAPCKCSLTYFTTQYFFIKLFSHFVKEKLGILKFAWDLQTKQTIVSEGQGRFMKGGSTNDYARLKWGEGVKLGLKKWSRDMWTLTNGTFGWLEIYEPLNYFPFSTRISLYKNRYIVLNILMLILILTLKSIKMKKTKINILKTYFNWLGD